MKAQPNSNQHLDPPAGRIRVLGVDDQEVVLDGLAAEFDSDGHLELAGRRSDASELAAVCRQLGPDLVTLDIQLPGPDVFEAADRMRRQMPHLRFVFLTGFVRDGYLAAALECGAWGYLAKSDSAADIIAALKMVVHAPQRTFVMSPAVKQHCIARGSPQMHGEPVSDTQGPVIPLLTAREVEVLHLIGQGLTRHQIAAELSRSVKTIDGHQDHIMRKLGAGSRADLVRYAIREGFANA